MLEGQILDFQNKYGAYDIRKVAEEQISHIAQLNAQVIEKELAININRINGGGANIITKNLQNERNQILTLIQNIRKGSGNYFQTGKGCGCYR